MYAKFSKCEFWLDRVQFFGHVLTPKGVSVDSSKVQDVLDWKSPNSMHQIRQFLSLAGYYRYFIPDFSKIAQPMTKLLQKEAKFDWSLACEEAFQSLKTFLTLLLCWPNRTLTGPLMYTVMLQRRGWDVCLCKMGV